MIRPTVPADTDRLVAIADGTRVFKPAEIVALREVLDDYHAVNQAAGHRSVTHERDGVIDGFAYFAPAQMTEGSWYLYWIAVDRARQGGGAGSALLAHVEGAIAALEGRILFIETSSLPHYAPTRRFYEKHGYEQTAAVRDYYADGDDMVVFRKRLSRRSGG